MARRFHIGNLQLGAGNACEGFKKRAREAPLFGHFKAEHIPPEGQRRIDVGHRDAGMIELVGLKFRHAALLVNHPARQHR